MGDLGEGGHGPTSAANVRSLGGGALRVALARASDHTRVGFSHYPAERRLIAGLADPDAAH